MRHQRFLAASQTVAIIKSQMSLAGAIALAFKGIVGQGKLNPTIQITYADGGTETWTINAALSSVSVVPGSNSNSLQPGDRKVKPSDNCPKQG